MAENQRTQIELHRHLASRYERRYADPASRAFHSAWHREMTRELAAGARVLDVGCGTGRLLGDLVERFDGCVGLDLSADMLRGAREYVPAARLARGDAERLPFASEAFDGILLKGCLHHLRDHAGFLAEARRVLRPGGRVVIAEPTEDAPWIRWGRSALHRWKKRAFDAGDRGFRTRELEALVQSAGLGLEASRPFGGAAYALAGFPDHVPALSWLPGGGTVARLLMGLDAAVLALPPASILAFQRVVVARRPPSSSA